MIEFVTFGLKHRPSKPERPSTTHNVDARFLPNPPKSLWTASRTEINQWISNHCNAAQKILYAEKLDFVTRLISVYTKTKLPITVGFYCYGGKHRSVYLSEKFAAFFRNDNVEVNVRHLDIEN